MYFHYLCVYLCMCVTEAERLDYENKQSADTVNKLKWGTFVVLQTRRLHLLAQQLEGVSEKEWDRACLLTSSLVSLASLLWHTRKPCVSSIRSSMLQVLLCTVAPKATVSKLYVCVLCAYTCVCGGSQGSQEDPGCLVLPFSVLVNLKPDW